MEIDVALLADAATIDAAGKINILGAFDRIEVQGFPAQHPRITLVLRFSGGLGDVGGHDVRLSMRGPKGEQVFGINGQIQVSAGPPTAGGLFRLPHVINLDGIVFQSPGSYAFDVSVDTRMLVTVPLLVAGPERGRAAQA
ncbi:MAG: hypothetical protein R3E98_13655 [Gemmatimonadota bacterium]|nr:hypothetical protein [Gemmatimonadota bacterium]